MTRRRIRKNAKRPLDPKSLDSFKAMLGPIAARYSDPQLFQLQSEMRAAARLLLDLYLLKKEGPDKAHQNGFDSPRTET
jgi:hypothetical protein